ncbi:hypothetical protein T4D_14599 [Trichinella pseudospiralis]|uniref:Reverse transcriptase/retrotransposon-derived protein RNase H-like domain-containing protein n=1 Tax=Trichinella pseudospiralis TaxID=6337 RepID=A0A0V1FPV0_TRIPS|nr:hypothetical protein T4D_14599 [Trichinella pseudospiralis]
MVNVDASEHVIRAVLSQPSEQSLPVIYASRSLSRPERSCSDKRREMQALVWVTRHFRRVWIQATPSDSGMMQSSGSGS